MEINKKTLIDWIQSTDNEILIELKPSIDYVLWRMMDNQNNDKKELLHLSEFNHVLSMAIFEQNNKKTPAATEVENVKPLKN